MGNCYGNRDKSVESNKEKTEDNEKGKYSLSGEGGVVVENDDSKAGLSGAEAEAEAEGSGTGNKTVIEEGHGVKDGNSGSRRPSLVLHMNDPGNKNGTIAINSPHSEYNSPLVSVSEEDNGKAKKEGKTKKKNIQKAVDDGSGEQRKGNSNESSDLSRKISSWETELEALSSSDEEEEEHMNAAADLSAEEGIGEISENMESSDASLENPHADNAQGASVGMVLNEEEEKKEEGSQGVQNEEEQQQQGEEAVVAEEREEESVIQDLEASAENGCVDSQLRLAAMYASEEDRNSSNDTDSSEEEEEEEEEEVDDHEKNNNKNHHQGGVRRKKRLGIRNYGKAMHWYKKAAIQKNTKAMVKMGEIYKRGELPAVPQSLKDAFQHFMEAAHLGDAKAQYEIGEMYRQGISERQERGHHTKVKESHEKDPQEAFRWYLMASKQGYVPAMVSVGRCYVQGNGVEEDTEKGISWLKKAIEAGNMDALLLLGQMVLRGEGFDQNTAVAYASIQTAFRREKDEEKKKEMEVVLKEAEDAMEGNILERSYAKFIAMLIRDGEEKRKQFRRLQRRKKREAEKKRQMEENGLVPDREHDEEEEEEDIDLDAYERMKLELSNPLDLGDMMIGHGQDNDMDHPMETNVFHVHFLFDTDPSSDVFSALRQQWEDHIMDDPLEAENREVLRLLGYEFDDNGELMDADTW